MKPLFTNTDYNSDTWNTLLLPISVFTLQLIVIIVAAQAMGVLFRRLKQPAVMGEILAGILLGPSFIGAIFPEFSAFVFPEASLDNLELLSQVGLILFMFVIGMELDLNIIRKRTRSAMLIGNIGIIFPFILGVLLSFLFYERYCSARIPFLSFALFTGISMSITAFPVLARIIRERKMTDSRAGSIAIISAAWGDIVGWSLLAAIIGMATPGTDNNPFIPLSMAVLYVLAMLFVVRPLLKKLSQRKQGNNEVHRSAIAIIFIVLLGSSYCSSVFGLHALFGAFLAGVIMPLEWDFRKLIIDKIEDVALVMLLPIFFIFTGLHTDIGLLNTPGMWATCLLIIGVAIAGKLGGSFLAARLAGENIPDSLSIGTLMNTRGLMELIILNIGRELGILSDAIFTMMVIMALVTTFMTGPLLNFIDRRYNKTH